MGKLTNGIISLVILYNVIYFTTSIKMFPWYVARPDDLHFIFSLLPVNAIVLLMGGIILIFVKGVSLLTKLLPFFMFGLYLYIIVFWNFNNGRIGILGLGLSVSYLMYLFYIGFILNNEKMS